MEFSHIIVRYGELTLKSGNRNEFLKKLTKNIRYNLQGLTGFHVQTKRDRMYIHLNHNEDVHEIMERLKRVPGIHNFSPVLRAGLDVEEAKKVIDKLLETIQEDIRSFELPAVEAASFAKGALRAAIDKFGYKVRVSSCEHGNNLVSAYTLTSLSGEEISKISLNEGALKIFN